MNKLFFRLMAFLLVLWLCPLNMQAQLTELEDGAVALSSKVGADNLLPKRTVTSDDLSDLKTEISSLIENTRGLINSVGTVTTTVKQSKVNLLRKLYANAPYTAGGTNHSDYSSAANAYNLFDVNTETYFHSDYSNNLPQIPYIRVDLGEGGATSKIRFNYTTRSNGNNCPTTIQVFGTNNTLGEITTAADLNKATAEISIAVKNISDTNIRYFAGTSNIEEYSDAVIFVWEPASEGYHYLRKYGTGEYIKKGSPDAKLAFGTKSEAQEFHAVEPVADGTGYNDYNNNNDFQTLDKLVRFVSKDNAIWINCQSAEGNPVYKNAAYGAWTAHNVYLVEGETPLGTFTSSDQSNPLPTDFSSWTSSDIELTDAYRFFKFAVTASESSKSGKPFFVMSEFGFTKVGTYEATVNSEYASFLTANQLIDALSAADALEGLIAEDTDLTQELLQTELENLQSKYNTIEVNKHRANLAIIISETDELIDKVADVTYTMSDEALSLTTDQNSPYYIWTNAPNTGGGSEGPIANLIDGGTDNFFHTQWDSNGKSTDGLDHYVEVDLGEGNKLSSFCFTYTTRKNVQNDYPQTMIIYGRNDTEENYTPIKVISNGMPDEGGKSYDSPVIDGGKEYRYLRFMVTKTNYDRVGEGKEHNYWHMAEFDIYPATAGAIIKPEFQSYITSDVVLAAYKEKLAASILLANSPTNNEVNTKYAALSEKYTALDTQCNSYYEKVEALTADINRLIEETDLLVNKVAIFSPYTLQNKDKLQAYYISSNAGHNTEEGNAQVDSDGEGIAGLLDDNPDTYFHSRWEGTEVSEPHYLQIDLGNGKSVNDLIFTYAPRPGNSPAPTAIEVRVGDDPATIGESEPIAIYTKDKDNLPAYNTSIQWTSNVISAAESFRYIRLTVTKSAGPGGTQFGGQYFFAMGSLSLKSITINEGFGGVTKDLVKTAVNETYDSKRLLMATPTIVELQSAYNELKTAYNNIIDAAENSATTINVLNSTGKVTGTSTGKWYNTWTSTATLGGSAALILTVGNNNITTAGDDYLRIYVGQSGSSTYTLTPAAGYYIESYSFDFKRTGDYGDNDNVTLSVDGNTKNPTDDMQSIASKKHNASESSVTFGMNGNNKGIIVSNFNVTLKPIVTSYVTYNYYFNGNLIGTERLAATVGGNYPTPVNVPKGYKASTTTPDGVVTALATVDIDCDIWSINIGGKLLDEWKPASWTPLAAKDIPETITNDVKINGTISVTEVSYKAGLIDIESPGYLSVDFEGFKGDSRLQIVGVDLLDNDGNVVASDYHFGYRGNNHENSIYLLNVAEAGIYNLRYLVSFQGEENVSNGEININLYAIDPLEKGKLYRIRSVSKEGYCKDKYVHTYCKATEGYDQRHLRFHYDSDIKPASLAIFTFENTDVAGEYKMKNLHTGMYVKTFLKNKELLGDKTTAANVKIAGFAPGQLILQINGERPMHAQDANKIIVDWNADADNASLWAIEEVDYSVADFDVSIGAVRWSTLCLNYAVEVPEGVTAYAALGVDGNSVVLQSVGDVIPAGTAVLLNLKEGAATGNYSFKYTSQSVESLSENKLVGTYYDSYIEADKENYKYYMLAKIEEKAGMKQIYREYDENGNFVSDENNPDKGTHFKNNANKVYLPVPKENGVNEVKAYSLRIIDGTTGVDEVVGNIGVAPEGIYDLSGRRIIEITEPGIYIVNGKKFIKK